MAGAARDCSWPCSSPYDELCSSQKNEASDEQYVFLGNPPPFKGGWHVTALDDFEHALEQRRLDPRWKGIRIWHKVNYVLSTTVSGEPALVPKEQKSDEL